MGGQAVASNLPPKGTDAGALWTTLTALPRPTSAPFEVQLRGSTQHVVFRVLTASELASVRATADKAAREFLANISGATEPGGLAYEESYEQEKACALLALACRQAEDPRFGAFPSAKQARQELTDDEISVLLVGYAKFRRESGPMLAELTREEMDAWVKLLEQGASRLPLARLSGEALSDLVMYLVSLRRSSPTGTSSAGSPPDGSGPATSAEVDANERAAID